MRKKLKLDVRFGHREINSLHDFDKEFPTHKYIYKRKTPKFMRKLIENKLLLNDKTR